MTIRPIGAVLAGGSGRHLGGEKEGVALEGRALVSYPLAALGAALDDVAVVVKRATSLPGVPGLSNVWVEPDGPSHPLSGVVHALRLARGRQVVICASDMVLVTPRLVSALAAIDPEGAPAVVSLVAGRPQPLFALYLPAALPLLSGFDPARPIADTVAEIAPRTVELGDPLELMRCRAPEDLLAAAAALRRRRVTQPNVNA